jgi:hypothetical protein
MTACTATPKAFRADAPPRRPSGNDGTRPSSIGVVPMAAATMKRGGERYANRHDGGREHEAILDGISTLQKALAEARFAPRRH